MSHRLLSIVMWAAFVWGSLNPAARALAKDYFLTIGGGYDVTANQLSLERNVMFQQSVLASKRPDRPSYDVWFADGNDSHPDVQCRDPKFEETCPLARRLLVELLGDADSADLVYRNSEIPNLKGPADLKQVKQRFADLATQVKSGDRVIIYFAGHGGKTRRADRRRRAGQSKPNPYNTTFYFWNTEQVTASDFAGWLDRFPADAQVVLVMVQCYAGGFAHTIFEQADANKGLSSHARCGFFAQQHDRAAAGCTPDAGEADYEEYSSYFWGALAGKSRGGKTVTTADYDKNGQVSFAEAHAYAVIESDTIDVPVRTTDAILREYSEIGDAGEESKTSAGDLLALKGPLAKLAADCRPDQRAVLEQLSVKIGLGAAATAEDAQQKLKENEDKFDAANAKLTTAARTRRSALKAVQNELYEIWPELRAKWAPLAIDLATDRADEFVGRVQKLPDYATLRYAEKREDELTKALLQLEREKARVERLLRTCEDAVLAANLPRVAEPETVKRFEQLMTMEEGTLADSSDTHGEASAAASAGN